MGGGASQQATMEKRAPVEFNHAISYVNKIKVRAGYFSYTFFLFVVAPCFGRLLLLWSPFFCAVLLL
jgi:hypothetical protein